MVGLNYRRYFDVLSYPANRLGATCTKHLWSKAFDRYDDTHLLSLLSTGWIRNEQELPEGSKIQPLKWANQYFHIPVEGINETQALTLVEQSPPIKQYKDSFDDFNFNKELTKYEHLQIKEDGFVTLVETLVKIHGKQGAKSGDIRHNYLKNLVSSDFSLTI